MEHSAGVKVSMGRPMAFQRPSIVRSGGLAEPALSLAEAFLDRFEVWAVGREVEQAGAGSFDGCADVRAIPLDLSVAENVGISSKPEAEPPFVRNTARPPKALKR